MCKGKREVGPEFIVYTGECRVTVQNEPGFESYVILEGIIPEIGKRLHQMQVTVNELYRIMAKVEEQVNERIPF